MCQYIKLKENVLLLAAVLGGTLFAGVSAANANDGTISFVGAIKNGTCTINGGSENGMSTGPDFTVTLPTVSTSAFPAIGNTAGDTPFYIMLSGANCAAGKYGIKFEQVSSSSAIDQDTGNLKNTVMTADAAKNIQLRITDNNHKGIDLRLGKVAQEQGRGENDTETKFNFGVQYISTNKIVNAGPVLSSLMYSVVYP